MFGIDDVLLGAGIGALGKLITGGIQSHKAANLKEDTYIPPEAKENQDLARIQNNATTYTGQSADEARGKQVVANAVGNVQRNAKSASDVLNSAANIEAGVGTNMANTIASRYQQFKKDSLNRLMGANNVVSGYQDRNHQQWLNYKKQLEGASLQNFWGGVSDIGGGIAANALVKNSPYSSINL